MADSRIERYCPQCGEVSHALVCPKDGVATLIGAARRAPLVTQPHAAPITGLGPRPVPFGARPAQGVDPLRPGARLADRYRLEQLVSTGPLGFFYEAVDTRTQAAVEVHVLPDADPGMVARFERQAPLLAALDHPYLVRVLAHGFTPTGAPYLVNEAAHGETLAELVAREGALDPRRLASIGLAILEALDAAHDVGLLHRSLGLHNVILRRLPAGELVKVAHLGLARIFCDDEATPFAWPPALVDAWRTMAPEQARGRGGTAHADLYSVGAVLYELLTGAPLFAELAPSDLLVAHSVKAPRPPETGGRVLSGPLVDVILRCLEKKPWNRPDGIANAHALLASARMQPLASKVSASTAEFGAAGSTRNARPGQGPSTQRTPRPAVVTTVTVASARVVVPPPPEIEAASIPEANAASPEEPRSRPLTNPYTAPARAPQSRQETRPIAAVLTTPTSRQETRPIDPSLVPQAPRHETRPIDPSLVPQASRQETRPIASAPSPSSRQETRPIDPELVATEARHETRPIDPSLVPARPAVPSHPVWNANEPPAARPRRPTEPNPSGPLKQLAATSTPRPDRSTVQPMERPIRQTPRVELDTEDLEAVRGGPSPVMAFVLGLVAAGALGVGGYFLLFDQSGSEAVAQLAVSPASGAALPVVQPAAAEAPTLAAAERDASPDAVPGAAAPDADASKLDAPDAVAQPADAAPAAETKAPPLKAQRPSGTAQGGAAPRVAAGTTARPSPAKVTPPTPAEGAALLAAKPSEPQPTPLNAPAPSDPAPTAHDATKAPQGEATKPRAPEPSTPTAPADPLADLEDPDFADRAPVLRKTLVQSDPEGAMVAVNGQIIGETPIYVEWQAGQSIDVVVSKVGYSPARTRLSAQTGRAVKLRLPAAN